MRLAKGRCWGKVSNRFYTEVFQGGCGEQANFDNVGRRSIFWDYGGTRAGRGDHSHGEPGGRWRAKNPSFAGGDRRPLRVLPLRASFGLAPDTARDAHPHAFCRHAASAFGEDARRRTAAIDVLSRFDSRGTVSP